MRRVDHIIRAVQALSAQDRQQVLRALQHDPGAGEPDADITELEGLGAEAWEGVDPDKYLRQERASWNRSTD